MPELKTEINFANPEQEGLNSDVDELLMRPGDSLFRLNCRSGTTDGKNVGIIENIKGNTKVSFAFSGGSHEVVGTAKDVAERRIYYFVRGTQKAEQYILRYNIASNTIEVVLQDSKLNFNATKKIINAQVLDGQLIWVNCDKRPMAIDIEKAINHTAGVPGGLFSYGTITDQILEAIKYPPAAPPTHAFDTDPDFDYNNIRGKLFQFCYRYVYDDNAKSVFSDYSKLALPQKDELPDGSFFEDQTFNNVIKVDLNTGTEEVKRVELAAREGNDGVWSLVAVFDKYDSAGNVLIASNIAYQYPFYNDRRGVGLSQSTVAEPFHYVPRLVEGQELISDERLLYSNIREGFDNVEMDVVLQPKQKLADFSGSVINFVVTSATSGSFVYFRVVLKIPVVVNTVYYLTINLISGDKLTVNYRAKQGDTIIDIRNKLIVRANSAIVEYFGGSLPSNLVSKDTLLLQDEVILVRDVADFDSVTGVRFAPINKIIQPKQGAYHQLGIEYSDEAGRKGYVNINNIYPDVTSSVNTKGRVFVPFLNPGTSGALYTKQFPYYVFDWQIRHQPPAWATKWQWVYSLNQSVSTFLQYYINDGNQIRRDTTDKKIYIDLNTAITDTNDLLRNSIISTYVWTKGDRARFVYRRPNVDDIQAEVIGDLIDVEILGQDPTSGEIILPDFSPENYSLIKSNSYTGFIIEVYTPKKSFTEDSQPYYGVGEVFEIGDPGTTGRYHKGSIQDQDPSDLSGTPAKGELETGDSYLKLRYGFEQFVTTPREFLYPVEEENFSDYYLSKAYDVGRVNFVNMDAREIDLVNYYRWGGRIVPLSAINELFEIKAANFDFVPLQHGAIVGIREIGFTLKIVQTSKLTSQYVGRTEYFDARASSNVQKTDSVLGTKNPSVYDYGCQDEEAILVHDRHLYFFDIIRQKVIRDAANGPVPISQKYFMDKYWRDFSEIILSEGYTICMGYDEKYDELNITVVPGSSAPQTIVFHELSNRWKSFRSYIPEWYGSLGNTFVAFEDGQLWTQNTNPIYNNFFGVQYPMILDCYGNDNAGAEKVYQSLFLHANKLFTCPNTGDIVTLGNVNYPNGMSSRLKEGYWKAVEGGFYAPFLRDINDPKYPDDLQSLLNGRELRGRSIKVQLTSEGSEYTTLSLIAIKATISEY
jgi:hypothetical protein